ncbi:CDGSH iron-sulfur domain-containing protein 1 isoform X1 [Sinocyclocheilus rhinocerous]|uniref:CDGSH iron-sulfur domain-containing protein 1-like n=1 Tax=Sinocyclocheilus rhinocerous TaxID=307959 RepID=A0A673L2W4_9TELE|nr:PREDICTED: CDGSH iron-sulfur domain-containing protein 1-like isoform X1 [Sinocyclocheilus rhinocerous]
MESQVPGLSALTKPGLIPGFKVSKDQLITIVPVAVAAALSTYLLTRYFSSQSSPESRVNMSINKDSSKVVHSFDMEDIGNKAVYCRCWRSKKFPYCDGAHTKHNEETGDNVGPLIIKKKNP